MCMPHNYLQLDMSFSTRSITSNADAAFLPRINFGWEAALYRCSTIAVEHTGDFGVQAEKQAL